MPNNRPALAGSHNTLAALFSGEARWKEAEAEYRNALAILQNLVDEFPGVPGNRTGLSQGYNNLGTLFGG